MITLAAVRAGIADRPEGEIVALAERLQLDISDALKDDGRQYTALLNGEDVTIAIRGDSIQGHLSEISAMKGVRRVVNGLQHLIAAHRQVIMAGRDIGTVVLPAADLKIYLDALLDVRAARRLKQLRAMGVETDFETVRDELAKRDAFDSNRDTAPLRKADDAVYLDSSDMTREEVVERVTQLILGWKAPDVLSRAGESVER